MATSDLTILSVKFGSEQFLKINHELVESMNPGMDYEWLIVDNDRQGVPQLDSWRGCRVLPGLPYRGPGAHGSYHHAAALEVGLAALHSRFLLVLDHDFYVIYPGWIEATLAHMLQHGLSFFGSIWHPRWEFQYRYFPSVHFMLIDLHQVPKESLTFTPAIDEDRTWHWLNKVVPNSLYGFKRLWQVGRLRDTGHALYQRFRQHPQHRYECLKLHYDHDRTSAELSARQRILRRFLPDRFNPTPQQRGFYTKESFLRSLAPAGYAQGWEEFFWQGKPFGFHLRRVGRIAAKQTTHDESDDISLLNACLSTIR